MGNNITFIVFTYNEENRIERVIKNFQEYGTVLVADNKSTDKTLEIAKKYGCDVYIRDKNYDFVENQDLVNKLYPIIKTDWIYWAFADEMLDRKTLDRIIEVINSEKYDVINIDRKNYYYGEFCYDMFHSRTNKCFRKGSIDFTNNKIHGFGEPTVPSTKIHSLPDSFFVHHFISYNAESYLRTIVRYTETEKDGLKSSINKSVWYGIYFNLKYIIKHLFAYKGIKAGFAAISLLNLMVFYYLLANIKRYEFVEGLDTKKIETLNDIQRDSILNKNNQ